MRARILGVQHTMRLEAAQTQTNLQTACYSAGYAGCQLAYPGFNLQLKDEVSGGAGPELVDLTRLPMPPDGTCLEGWLTPAGYELAKATGQTLRDM